MGKKIIFIITIFFIIFFLGRSLNPMSSKMFKFHDATQGSRIKEFSLNLRQGKIPPRIAPNFSFRLGYPVFNFYAPFAYWVTSFINLLGFNVVGALKLSFLLTIVLSFVFMYLFLKQFFSFYPSLLGAVFYGASPYFAVEILIRGNLAEAWFIALFPLGLFFLTKNSQSKIKKHFFITTIILSFLFTVHNIFSFISLVILILYSFLLNNKLRNLLAIVLGLMIGSYFLFPALMESKLTYATQIAKQTKYSDHFLCLWQIWDSPWGYGGSVPGCSNDGVSFKLGKLQIIFGFLGSILFLLISFSNKKDSLLKKVSIFFLLLTLLAIFSTTYQSELIWKLFKPVLSIFQFPWRLLILGMFGLSYFSGLFFEKIRVPFKSFIILLVIAVSLIVNSKYFFRPMISINKFKQKYLSQEYVLKYAAFNIPEYLPKVADFNYWQRYNPYTGQNLQKYSEFKTPIVISNGNYKVVKNNDFEKEIEINKVDQAKVNLHYFPFWKIYLDNKPFVPKKYDKLGRPEINLSDVNRVSIVYNQTDYEKIANVLTLLSILFVIVLSFKWKKNLKLRK